MKSFKDVVFFVVCTLLTLMLTVLFICAALSRDAVDIGSRIAAAVIAAAIPAAYVFGMITYLKKPRRIHAKVTKKELIRRRGHVSFRALYYNYTVKTVELYANGRLKRFGCDDELFYDLKEGESYDLLVKAGTILDIFGRKHEEDGFDEDIDREYDCIYPDGRKG